MQLQMLISFDDLFLVQAFKQCCQCCDRPDDRTNDTPDTPDTPEPNPIDSSAQDIEIQQLTNKLAESQEKVNKLEEIIRRLSGTVKPRKTLAFTIPRIRTDM